MKDNSVKQASVVLNLQRNIIGIKFVDFEGELDDFKFPISEKNGPLCYLLREAMEGNVFKVVDKNITCAYAKYAIGLSKPDITISQGCSYHYCGLYESRSVAREIISSMKYLDHEIYGVVIGPLQLMRDADIVIMVDYAETIMRVMQGYAYKFGSPHNLNFFGNQAVCGDLISKPYSNNDINISLMCRGMRANGRFEKGELGVAVPINMFDTLIEGVVATVNPVCSLKEKKRIVNVLNSFGLNVNVNMDYNYGLGLKEYDNMIRKLREK